MKSSRRLSLDKIPIADIQYSLIKFRKDSLMKATFALALFAIFLSSAAATFESCVAFAGFSAFNLCPFSKKDINFTVTTLTAETITFSIADDHITSCDGTQKVYAIDKTLTDSCYDISQASPAFSLMGKKIIHI